MGDTPGAVTVGVGIGCGGRAGNGAFGIDIGISLARITVEGRLIPPTVSIAKGSFAHKGDAYCLV